MICVVPRNSVPSMRPRREIRSPITSTHVLVRNHHFDAHDRLEQHRLGACVAASLNAHRAADLERHFRRIDVVVSCRRTAITLTSDIG